jgi:hypothetical protein
MDSRQQLPGQLQESVADDYSHRNQQFPATGCPFGMDTGRTIIGTESFSDFCAWKINTHDRFATPASTCQTLMQSTNLLASLTCLKLAASIGHQLLFVL